jgi:hypothetical protein
MFLDLPRSLNAAARLLERLFEIARQRRSHSHRTGNGRAKFDLRKMEPETVIGKSIERRPAIERVAGNRMARFGEVNANLMTHPGARPCRDQSEIPQALYRLDQRRGGARAGDGDRDRNHPSRIARIVRERIVDLN